MVRPFTAHFTITMLGRMGQHLSQPSTSAGSCAPVRGYCCQHRQQYHYTAQQQQQQQQQYSLRVHAVTVAQCASTETQQQQQQQHDAPGQPCFHALQPGQHLERPLPRQQQQPGATVPRQNETHIWWSSPADVPWQQLTAQYEALLPSSELQRVNEATSQDLRRERLLARVLARTSLACSLGDAAPQGLVFQYNAHGKPSLCQRQQATASAQQDGSSAALDRSHQAGSSNGTGTTADGHHGVAAPPLYHNLTHTPGLVGCAVAPCGPVGLDVELIARRPQHLLALARRRLSALEYEALSAVSSDEERAALFMRLWTLKEAFVKCRGVGINAPPGLRGFTIGLGQAVHLDRSSLSAVCGVPLGKADPLAVTLQLHAPVQHSSSCISQGDSGGNTHWRFLLMQPSADHVAALCVEQPGSVAVRSSHQQPCDQQSLQVAMLKCVPLQWHRPLTGDWPVLLGCSP